MCVRFRGGFWGGAMSVDLQLEELQERRKRKRWRAHLSYSVALLILMLILGIGAGLYAYRFGQEALRGVKPSPPSVRLPTIAPDVTAPEPKPSPKPAPKQSYFLDESTTISDNQAIFQAHLGHLTRPHRQPTPVVREPQFLFEQQYESRLAQIRQRIDASSRQRFQEMQTGISMDSAPLPELNLYDVPSTP